jgi:CheY-specific phosphatase CheX
MTFQGEFQGSLMLAMPEGMAREIAANFLGVDADDPSAATAGGDALKEMLNIACGNMLTALCGTKPVFDLSMPEVAPLDCEHLAALAGSPDALVFEVEGYPVVLHAELGRGVWILAEGER